VKWNYFRLLALLTGGVMLVTLLGAYGLACSYVYLVPTLPSIESMRNVELAQDLVRQDAEINRLNRAIFRRAVEIGDDVDTREWAMFMILVARALERVGDNTVDIAEQVVFVVTGLFREVSDSTPAHDAVRPA